MLPTLDKFIDRQRSYYITVFESRYGRGVIALLSFDLKFPVVVEEAFQGGDDDDAYIGDLLRLDYYPIAYGDNATGALKALDTKLQFVPVNSATDDNLSLWLDQVATINRLVEQTTAYYHLARGWALK